MDETEDRLIHSAGWMMKFGRETGLPVFRRATVVREAGEPNLEIKVQASRSTFSVTEGIAKELFDVRRFSRAAEELAKQDRAANLGRRVKPLSLGTANYLERRGIQEQGRPGDSLTTLIQAWHSDRSRRASGSDRFVYTTGRPLADASRSNITSLLSPKVRMLAGNALAGGYASQVERSWPGPRSAEPVLAAIDRQSAPAHPQFVVAPRAWPADMRVASRTVPPQFYDGPVSHDRSGWPGTPPIFSGQHFAPSSLVYEAPISQDHHWAYPSQGFYAQPSHLPQQQGFGIPHMQRSLPHDPRQSEYYTPPAQGLDYRSTQGPRSDLVAQPQYWGTRDAAVESAHDSSHFGPKIDFEPHSALPSVDLQDQPFRTEPYPALRPQGSAHLDGRPPAGLVTRGR